MVLIEDARGQGSFGLLWPQRLRLVAPAELCSTQVMLVTRNRGPLHSLGVLLFGKDNRAVWGGRWSWKVRDESPPGTPQPTQLSSPHVLPALQLFGCKPRS